MKNITEKNWITKFENKKMAAFQYIKFGYILMGIAIWFHPLWFWKLLLAGGWLIGLGILKNVSLSKGEF